MTRGLSARRNGLRLRAVRVAREEAPSSLGIVCRGMRGAVERNLIRRRIRAAFRAVGPPTGWKVGVWAAAETGGLDFQELTETLRGALADVQGEAQ